MIIVFFLKFGHRKSPSSGVTGNSNISSGSAVMASPAITKDKENESSLEAPTEANSNSKVTVQASIIQTQQDQKQVTQTVQQSQQRPLGQQARANRFRRLVSTFQQKGATNPENPNSRTIGLLTNLENSWKNAKDKQESLKKLMGNTILIRTPWNK